MYDRCITKIINFVIAGAHNSEEGMYFTYPAKVTNGAIYRIDSSFLISVTASVVRVYPIYILPQFYGVPAVINVYTWRRQCTESKLVIPYPVS